MSPNLSQVAALVYGARLVGRDAEFVDLTLDSKEVKPGWLFCATQGSRHDGHDFASEAARNGATALLVDHEMEIDIPQLVVPSVRDCLGPISAMAHGYPVDKINLVGITGTNGKTTTAYFLESILRTSGHATGLIGTIEARYPNARRPSIYTTPEAPELHRYLADMADQGVDSVVMEVSSHGIDQHRVSGTRFRIAIFTNLAAEHLDYHGTIEQYYSVKAQLFTPLMCEHAIICVDDEWGRRLAAQTTGVPVTTYGFNEDADVRIIGETVSFEGTSFAISGEGFSAHLNVNVAGRCNAQNATAAFIAARALGATTEEAALGLKQCEGVEGRFQQVDLGQSFHAVVDYAHTPDSIKALVTTARELISPGNKVILVAGARGRRDRLKRPELGRAAATADLAILTTDNPGDEAPSSIVAQLIAGTIDQPHRHFMVEFDRATAISLAVEHASEGDIILVVGRGHEESYRVGTQRIMLDDRDELTKAIAARLHLAPHVSPVPTEETSVDRLGANANAAH